MLSSTHQFVNREQEHSGRRGLLLTALPPGDVTGMPVPKARPRGHMLPSPPPPAVLVWMPSGAVLHSVRLLSSQFVSSFQDRGYRRSARFQKAELGATEELEFRFQLNRQRFFLRIRLGRPGPGCPGRWRCLVAEVPRKKGWPPVGVDAARKFPPPVRAPPSPQGLQDLDSTYRPRLDMIRVLKLACLNLDIECHLPHRAPGGRQHG